MKDFRDLWSLLSHVEARVGHLSDVAMGAFFLQGGKLMERGKGLEPTQEDRVRRLCRSVQVNMAGGAWSPRSLCDAMLGLAKMGVRPSDEFVQLWGKGVLLRLQDCDEAQLAGVVYALGKLNLNPDCLGREWFAQWASMCVERRFRGFSAQSLSTSMWGLAKMQVHLEWLGKDFVQLWAKACRAEFAKFTAPNLSISLYSAAVLGVNLEEDLGQDYVKQWCLFMRTQMSEASPQNLANILYALALLDVSPDEEFAKAWTAACCVKWPHFSAQNLANIIWALGKLVPLAAVVPIAFLREWAMACEAQFPLFNQQNLTNAIWGVARLNAGPALIGSAWFASWSYQCTLKLHRFTPQGLANTWWALATLELEDSAALGGDDFYTLLAQLSRARWREFGEQELSNALWALGKLELGEGIVGLDTIKSWLGASIGRLSRFEPQAISNVIWALGKLDDVDHRVKQLQGGGAWFSAWSVACLGVLGNMSAQSLANSIYGVARLQLGYEELDRRFFQRWAEACLPQLPHMTPQGLGNVIYSVANLNLLQGNLAPTFVPQWSAACVVRMDEFYPQALSMTMDGVAGLELRDPALLAPGFFEKWSRVCLREMRSLNSEDLALIVSALGELRDVPVVDELYPALVAACLNRLASFKTTQLARTLAGFALLDAGLAPQLAANKEALHHLAREMGSLLLKVDGIPSAHAYKAHLGALWFNVPLPRPSRRWAQGRPDSLVARVAKVVGPSFVRNGAVIQDLVEVDLLDEQQKIAIFVDDDRRFMADSSRSLKSIHVLEQRLIEQRAGFRVVRFEGAKTATEIREALAHY